jgi:NAD(P)-dependent dehydrogenase (short-subunit alcohol dehydrogenase family)
MKLRDKVAVITGGGSGIGRAIVLKFAGEGASVAIFDINEENANRVAAAAKSLGRGAIALIVDVSNFLQAKKGVESVVKEFKKIDILVNNAGFTNPCPAHEMPEDMWDRIMAVNLKGVFNCCRWVLPHMYAQKSGRIINMSSIAGVSGTPLHTHYAAAKGGVIGYTRALAKAVAAEGQITCNSLSPAYIDDTSFYDFDRAALKKAISGMPLGRLGTPEDIAHACLYLASDEASFITGVNLNISGGAFIYPV